MQAEKQQQSWKVNIQARAQSFSFKLKATKLLPSWKFHRLSVKFILKLQVKSGSAVSISTPQKRTLKSTFLRLLEKLRIRRGRSKKAFTIRHPDAKSALNRLKQFANERSIGGSLVIAILASLLQSISKKDFSKGFLIQTSIAFMYWILYLKRYITGKNSTFWMILMVGTAACWAILHFGKGYMFQGVLGGRLLLLAVGNAALQVIFGLVQIFFSNISKLKE